MLSDYIPYINMTLLVLAIGKLIAMFWLIRKVKRLMAYQNAELHELNERNANIMRFVKNSGEEINTEKKGS